MGAWTLLFVAGLCETAWAIGLKYTDGFRRLGPSLFVASTVAVSMVLLAWVARTLPIGTAYAVWTGIGALGAAILGIVLFREPATPLRLLFLGLLIVSLLGLKVTG